MLKYEDDSGVVDAAQAQVSARDLMEALASIEIRNARRAFDQAGTLTLAEAVAECSVEVTPEELRPEIEQIRVAEAMQQKARRWQRLLRLGLGAEVVSAALCLFVLFGMRQTVFNPSWQQVKQARALQQKIVQSVGSNAKYELWVTPQQWGPASTSRANSPTYTLYSLPDGCNIHHFDQLDDGGHSFMMSLDLSPSVEVRERTAPFFRDNVSVYYNGAQYWRGAIRKKDIPSLSHSGYFTLYPALVLSPPYQLPDAVPLTVSMQSIEAAHGVGVQSSPECYNEVLFLEGNHVSLDEHAWEQYQATSK